MQVLAKERLWAAKRWMSWRNYYEYLGGTLWWLEGVATVIAFAIPAAVLLSGARASTAPAGLFAVMFAGMLTIRMWGVKRLFRHHIHLPTAFALRILRIPVGLSCLWWLLTRRTLKFEVTPKAGAASRARGRVPLVLWVLFLVMAALALYAVAGLAGLVPWHAADETTVAAGAWLLFAIVVLGFGIVRIRAVAYATSRRNAYRTPLTATVTIAGVNGQLVNISVGGAAVTVPEGAHVDEDIDLALPGGTLVPMRRTRVTPHRHGGNLVGLTVRPADWAAFRAMSLWLFHTPPGAVEDLPAHAPAVAARATTRKIRTPVLARQYGSHTSG